MPSLFRQLREVGKRAVDRNEYSSAAVEEFTQEQLAAELRVSASADFWTGDNIGLFTALRSHIAASARTNENEAMAQSIEGSLAAEQRLWFRANATRYEECLDNAAIRAG